MIATRDADAVSSLAGLRVDEGTAAPESPWSDPALTRPSDFSREHALVLELAARFCSGSRAPLPSGPFEWQEVLKHAAFHGVLSIVHHQLVEDGLSDLLGEEGWARLRALHVAQSASYVSNRRVLHESLNLLSRAGIAAMPLKGATVAQSTYAIPALRRVGDIDLVVHPGSFRAAVEVLKGAGFSHEDDIPDPFHSDHRFVYDLKLKSPDRTRLLLELHWLLCDDPYFNSPRSALDTRRVWERSREHPHEAGARVLSPEDELLYLCGHAMKHRWRALYALVDIALYVQREDVDWERVAELKRGFAGTWTYEATLILVSALLRAPLPPPVQENLIEQWHKHPRLRSIVSHASKRWILAERIADDTHRFVPWERYMAIQKTYAMNQRGVRNHITYLIGQATGPDERDFDLVKVPDSLSWVRRITRPLRLLMVHARYCAFRLGLTDGRSRREPIEV